MAAPLPAKTEAFLLVLAQRIAPGTRDLSSDGIQAFFRILREGLAGRPPALQRQFLVFLSAVRWLPALRFGAPFDRLTPEKQDAALRWFQNAPASLLRKGFWGLKTLIYMGYFGQPELAEKFAYRPSREGNSRLAAQRR